MRTVLPGNQIASKIQCKRAWVYGGSRDDWHRAGSPQRASPNPSDVAVSRRRSAENGQSGASFAERLSPLIAKGGKKRGVIPVPALLIHFQSRLHLTDGELVYVLHVLDEKREPGKWPWLAVSSIALAMGRDERNVRSRKESLEKRGYLVCRPMYKDDGSRGGDEHDLSGLFAQLERLAIELSTTRALDQAHTEEPEPVFYRGQLELTSVQPTRPRLAVRRRKQPGLVETKASADLTATTVAHPNQGGGGENAPTPLAKMPPPGRRNRRGPAGEITPRGPAKSPGHEETSQQTPITESPTNVPQTGLAAASRPPGSRATTIETSSSIDRAEEDGDDLVPVPGYYDTGISAYIAHWAGDFGDNDSQRSLEQAHHIWWNSKLPRWVFHQAMKAARHQTERKGDASTAFGAPMAYFFKVLRTEVAQRCDRMGLGRVDEVSDLVDGDAVALAEPDRESTVTSDPKVAAGYDKAQVRERVWRRVSPEERAAMWQMGSTEDRAAYRELVAQGLDWPGAADALAASLPEAAPRGNSRQRAVAGAA